MPRDDPLSNISWTFLNTEHISYLTPFFLRITLLGSFLTIFTLLSQARKKFFIERPLGNTYT
jgi:hypothetical protein